MSIKLHFCSEPITTTTPASPASCHLDPLFSQKPEKGKKGFERVDFIIMSARPMYEDNFGLSWTPVSPSVCEPERFEEASWWGGSL